MTITARYIGQSTIQVSTAFTLGQSSSNLITFKTFADTVSDAITGTGPTETGPLSGVVFDATLGVTAQSTATYSPTPSTRTGWTLFDSFWGGADNAAGLGSPVYTQVFRSVNKDGITAKNIVLRYNIKEQQVNASTVEWWDTRANYDAGLLLLASPTASTTATADISSTTITVLSGTGIVVGQYIIGNGIPLGATVTVVSGTTITISSATTAALVAGTAVTFTTPTASTTTNGSTAAGSYNITVTSVTNIAVGQTVHMAGLPSYRTTNGPLNSNTTVTSITGSVVTLSNPVPAIVATGTTIVFMTTSHAGTNEAWTFFDCAPVSWSLTACDFIIDISPRWCLLHSYINNEPTMWAGVFEMAREDITDTPDKKTPCWGWISSTLWFMGAAAVTSKPISSGTTTDYPLICMPRTKSNQTSYNNTKTWGADYGVTACPTWFTTTPASFTYYLGNGGSRFLANYWDSSRRLTLPIKPIYDYATTTNITNYGQIYGLKVLAPVGQNMNKINIAADSDGNSSTSASDRAHWILNQHHKTCDATDWFANTTFNASTSTITLNNKPGGMVSCGSMAYCYSADGTRISKIDLISNTFADITTGQTGYSDIKYDGERYVYVTSTTAALAITKIDISADTIGNYVTIAATSGTSGTFVIAMANVSGVSVGQNVTGTNIGAGAVVQSISGLNVTLTVANAGTVGTANITFTNTGIVSILNVTGGYSCLALSGDTICCASGTANTTPTFVRYQRQTATGVPAIITATAAASAVTAPSAMDGANTVIVRDMTCDFEGNFWAVAPLATVANFKLMKIDRAGTCTYPTFSAAITPTNVSTGVGLQMIDGNTLVCQQVQTLAAAMQHLQVNPRSLATLSNVVGPNLSPTNVNTSVGIIKIQGNIVTVPRNSGTANIMAIASLGKTSTNIIMTPTQNKDNAGIGTQTANQFFYWDGGRLYFPDGTAVFKYYNNFNGGLQSGGNTGSTGTVTLGQIALPA